MDRRGLWWLDLVLPSVMRSLVESTLGLSTAGWYDRVWFWSCSTGFGSDVRFFIARNTDVAGDPVNGEGFVAVFHVRLNIFVQCEIVTMWIADVFNGTLAVRVDDDVSCWLGLGVADCFADGRQRGAIFWILLVWAGWLRHTPLNKCNICNIKWLCKVDMLNDKNRGTREPEKRTNENWCLKPRRGVIFWILLVWAGWLRHTPLNKCNICNIEWLCKVDVSNDKNRGTREPRNLVRYRPTHKF